VMGVCLVNAALRQVLTLSCLSDVVAPVKRCDVEMHACVVVRDWPTIPLRGCVDDGDVSERWPTLDCVGWWRAELVDLLHMACRLALQVCMIRNYTISEFFLYLVLPRALHVFVAVD